MNRPWVRHVGGLILTNCETLLFFAPTVLSAG
jgi:hypothetical protein